MKPQNAKERLQGKPESTIVVRQPMVRNFSTGGGHGPEDTIVEGDSKLVTKKWQGYPPENLKVIGQSMPPIPEVAIPRFTGKAEYTTRVWFPNLLYAKMLTSPHPHAMIRDIDTSRAEKMPGVAHVLTYKNSPMTYPMPRELNFQGEMVAIIVAETEDLAEDALEALQVDYDVLPFAGNLQQSMAPNAPDLRRGRGNLVRLEETNPHYDASATWASRHGDIERGFAEASVIREFTYYFGGGVSVPIQPCGSLAKWEGEKLTLWGMSQGIYPQRDNVARALGMDPKNVRFINRYNGCTFGAARAGSQTFYPLIAHLAKVTGRPVKMMLPKDQELAQIQVKPEILTKFKVGANREGRIIALQHEVYINGGDSEGVGHAGSEVARNQTELYTSTVPHWKSTFWSYKTNSIRIGPSRSYTQQEIKWAWESMIDEMAEAVGIDPIQFKLMHVSKPGTKLSPVKDWDSGDLARRYEVTNGEITYDSFASVEVLQEGAKAFGWEKRNPMPGASPGRFKRGVGVAISQHHAGQMGYHEGEAGFEKRLADMRAGAGGGGGGVYGGELEVTADGSVILRSVLPESGSNHDTGLAAVVAEMLGFTTRDRIRVLWGDSDLGPSTAEWFGGRTITLQGAAIFNAADKLRKDLIQRASNLLKVDATELQIKDGVISSIQDPRKRTTFSELVRANRGGIRQQGRGIASTGGRAMVKGFGACFVEVEVDTWTGDWRFLRSVYGHDTGILINPLVAEADMHGSLVESAQIATDPLPWDREFPGTRHYSVGYLSYRLPTIMDVPEQTNVFVDSLEPRWYYGIKSFSETTIGCVPPAIANAIYNACGVRIREHPITKDKIMAGLRARAARG
jgi:CO/xanthine dehydrogenase Mo-binding subunit